MSFRRSLVWLRRDLRLGDHAALSEATVRSDSVAVVFVFDPAILKPLSDRDDRRVTFIHRSLAEVDEGLRRRGSALIRRYGDPVSEVPAMAAALRADAVFAAEDYEPQAKARDARVGEALSAAGARLLSVKDQVVFNACDVLKADGNPYRVFTPYRNAWTARLTAADLSERRVNLSRMMPKAALRRFLESPGLSSLGFSRNDSWLDPGSLAAAARLRRFARVVDRYHLDRDYPSREGTSGLSAHLRFGTISIRELFRFARSRQSQGARVWENELIWREFYQMILERFPRVLTWAFRKEYDSIRWPGTEESFEAWRSGKTGFPLVDAAMRHFERTGWMHNRLRMIVASFLSKDLLVDWRKGEAWFARRLLDFDAAANNGGWQWSASTGCDASPYFRIFNPIEQSKRYDPKGEFIRSVLPELSLFTDRRIHFPSSASAEEQIRAKCRIGVDYPDPIVDHGRQRVKALALYRGVR